MFRIIIRKSIPFVLCAGHSVPLYAYKDPPAQYAGLQLKDRQGLNHSAEWYSAHFFFSYCLYPPLYLTGPTITFNDFVCQLRQPRYPSVCALEILRNFRAAALRKGQNNSEFVYLWWQRCSTMLNLLRVFHFVTNMFEL